MPEGKVPVVKAYVGSVENPGKAPSEIFSRGLPAEDPFDYDVDGAIIPPFDFEVLAYFLEINTEHARSVKQKALDVVAGGYRLRPRVPSDQANQEHYRILTEFFEEPNEEQTLVELLECVQTDFESLGNGYLEVVPNLAGQPCRLYHLPAKTMRVRKGHTGFVQRRGTQRRFFKNFGDKSIMNMETGEVDPSTPLEKRATEVIHIKNYHPKSEAYGIPDFLPAIGAIIGNVNVRDYNNKFFENSAVPLFCVILEGAVFDDETKHVIENFFQHEIRGTRNAHKTLILEVPPAQDGEQPGRLTLKPLQQVIQDASFRNFRIDNRDEILRSHNMPPFRIGIVEVGNIGTGTGAAQLLNYQQTVVKPRQQKLAYRINRLISSEAGFGFKDWKFEFITLDMSEKSQMALIHERYARIGAMTINEIREELGKNSIKGGDKLFLYVPRDRVTFVEDLENDSPVSQGDLPKPKTIGKPLAPQTTTPRPQTPAIYDSVDVGGEVPLPPEGAPRLSLLVHRGAQDA